MLLSAGKLLPSRPPACHLSLRLGHAVALTAHRAVIHYRSAASLPQEGGMSLCEHSAGGCRASPAILQGPASSTVRSVGFPLTSRREGIVRPGPSGTPVPTELHSARTVCANMA